MSGNCWAWCHRALPVVVGLTMAVGALPRAGEAVCASPSFNGPPPVNFAVGTGPLSVAVADFNADGTPDLAIANRLSNDVSILLGTGNGGFGTATNFAVGSAPVSVAVADFNADGTPDLATANASSYNVVSILLGTGSGSFGAATNFAVGSIPTSVAVGDFNGDGTADLATANASSNNVSILLGTGSGGFGAATNFTVGLNPVSVAVGDFNADGTPDLAIANLLSTNVSILLGTGSGGFGAATNFAVGSIPRSVAVGDLNADGTADLAVAKANSNNVSILLGTGSGSFGAATNFAVGSAQTSVAVGDFNADGTADLATANGSSNNVSVLLGTGSGSFGAATNFAVGSAPTSVAVGDFNGDGTPDLATANSGSNDASVLLNTCSPLAQGNACSAGADCASGFCADRVCCGTACGGSDTSDCQACSVAAGAMIDGTCALFSSTTVCRAGGACDPAETCTGASAACPGDVMQPNGTSCSDGTFCNGAEQCQDGVCQNGTAPCALLCDEGANACETGCLPAPQSCRAAAKSILRVKDDGDNAKDQLVWKWITGASTTQAEFGDPTTTADYALCIYAGAASDLVGWSIVPASASKWGALSTTGYQYKDAAAAEGGIAKAILKGSDRNRSKAVVKGKGSGLPDLPLPIGGPLTVQLVNGDTGLCWGAEYYGAELEKNETGKLKAKSGSAPVSCDQEGPTFTDIQNRIFTDRGCNLSTCHGNFASANLDLRPGSSLLSLVNIPADNSVASAAGKVRVLPGNAAASFLSQKLHGTLLAGEGSRMPLVGGALPQVEIDVIDAWIDAGAPAVGEIPRAPCLPPLEYQETPPPPVPPGGYQVVLDGPWLQPGQEQEGCLWLPVPNPADFIVGRWEFSLNPGTHHFSIFPYTHAGVPPIGVWTVGDFGCISGADFGANLSGAPQAPFYIDAYPSGVGRVLEAGGYIGLNAHYHNPYDVPIQMKVWTNLYPYAGTPEHLAVTLTDYDDMFSISVPPFTQKVQHGRYTNLTGQTLNIFQLTGHMHKRGLRFTAYASDGSKLYENFDWAHPVPRQFNPYFLLAPGDYIDYECLHDNGVTREVKRNANGDPITLTFGVTTDDEMCTLNAQYY